MRRLPSFERVATSGVRLPADAVVAIDGPAGSGKSTTAQHVAQHHGLSYVDTGAMYRALTRAALDHGIAADDETRLADLLQHADLTLKTGRKESLVIWGGRDVSQAIRAPEVDAQVSAVSAHPTVRQQMVERQRALGRRGGVVMEGRDIGSVVFPLATAKIYLDASLAARADRRFRQFQQRGQTADRAQVEADLAARDRLDSERSESPLTIAPDALVLDTSDWSQEEQHRRAALACLVNPYLDAQLVPLTDPAACWHALPGKYRLAYSTASVFARTYSLRVVGLNGRVPPPGVLLASNHVTQWDPPLLGSTFRRAPVRAMAKAELFRFAPLDALLRWLEVIPVRRAGFDRSAFATAGATLASGGCLLMFPEGTRRPLGEPGPILAGLGLLAQETHADILPIFLRGTSLLRVGGNPDAPLEVRYGPLMRLHALPILLARYGRRDVCRRIGAQYLAAVRELQARSFAEHPLSETERREQARQIARDEARKRPFARPDRNVARSAD